MFVNPVLKGAAYFVRASFDPLWRPADERGGFFG